MFLPHKLFISGLTSESASTGKGMGAFAQIVCPSNANLQRKPFIAKQPLFE